MKIFESKNKQFPTPDAVAFTLWRAVFSLVHVDGNFSDEERAYIDQIMDVFSFSRAQRKVIRTDLNKKTDVVDLFHNIIGDDYRHQFFMMAQTIVWCDDYLHELELEALERVIQSLDGNEAKKYDKDLQWLKRKPMIAFQEHAMYSKANMVDIVVRKMSAFYEDTIL